MSDDAKVSLGKGRPTPKRSEAQKRRGGPVLPPPATRREAAQRQKAERAAARKAGGSRRVDAGRQLARDAGPVRALVRDVVDGRRNVAVVMLPVALLLVVAQMVATPAVLSVAVTLWSAVLVVVAVDLVVIGVTVRRAVRAQWPGERARGHISYGLLRSTVIRRFRMPRPRVQPAGLFRR